MPKKHRVMFGPFEGVGDTKREAQLRVLKTAHDALDGQSYSVILLKLGYEIGCVHRLPDRIESFIAPITREGAQSTASREAQCFHHYELDTLWVAATVANHMAQRHYYAPHPITHPELDNASDCEAVFLGYNGLVSGEFNKRLTEFREWVRWQRQYRVARAQGKSDDDARAFAGGLA